MPVVDLIGNGDYLAAASKIRNSPEKFDSLKLLGYLDGVTIGSTEPPESNMPTSVYSSLTACRSYYHRQQYDAAFEAAYQAKSSLTKANGELLRGPAADMANLLAFLHADLLGAPDSVDYYANLGAELLSDAPSASPLVAENLLARSIPQFYYADPERGLELAYLALEQSSEGNTSSYFRTHALNIVAQFHKKVADFSDRGRADFREEHYLRADSLLRVSIQLSANSQVGRLRESIRERYLLGVRLKDETRKSNALKDLAASPPEAPVVFTTRDWLLGYQHAVAGNPDSSLGYFKSYLDHNVSFNRQLKDEALFRSWPHLAKTERYPEADQLLNELLNMYDCIPEPTDARDVKKLPELFRNTAPCLNILGAIANTSLQRYEKQGRPGDLDLSIQLYRHIHQQFLASIRRPEDSKILGRQLYSGENLVQPAITAAYLKYKVTGEEEDLDVFLFFSERSKASLLLRDLLGRSAASNSHWADIKRQQQAIRQKQLASSLSGQEDESSLAELQQNLDQSIDNWTRDTSHFFRLMNAPAPTLAHLRALADKGKATLLYAGGNKDYYRLLVSSEQTVLETIGEISSIDSLVNEQITLGKTFQQADSLKEINEGLAKVLLPPQQRFPDKENLLIAPEASLQRVDFSALPLNGNQQYLGTSNPFRVAASIRVDMLLSQQRKETFDVADRIQFWTSAELSPTLGEIPNDVRFSAEGAASREIDGPDCSPDHFMRTYFDTEILHLSLHGKADLNTAGGGLLRFSNDEELYEYEIGSGTVEVPLVVLAACETRAGNSHAAEGLFSVARAFTKAGAAEVVCSTREVPLAATRELLLQFYTHLYAGAPTAQALQMAKRDMADGMGGARFRHPFYWSGMVLN